MMAHYRRAALGAGLILLAWLLPIEAIAPLMTGAKHADARLGLNILRVGLAVNGVFALVWAASPPGWFRGLGMPADVAGLISDQEAGGRDRRQPPWRALLLILAVGAVLRLIGLNRDLWLDEIATVVGYLRLSPWQNLYAYDSSNQHLLYSLLGSLSLSLFGESAWAARLPAVLFGVGSLAALYLLGRAVAPEREALLASALMSASYHHVWFSQNARGYTGMLFFALMGTWLFLRGLTGNRTRAWAGYVVSMTAGNLILQQTAFLFASHVTAYLLTLPQWPGWRARHGPLTRRVLAIAILVVLFSIQAHSLMLPRMIEFFRTEERPGLGITDPAVFAQVLLRGLQTGFLGIGLLLGVLLLGSGWLSYWRQSPLVAGLLVLPPVFGVLAMLVLRYGAYPRAFLYVLPLSLLLVVRGAMEAGDWLARRLAPAGGWRRAAQSYLGLTIVGLMLALSAVSLIYYYRYPKQDYTGALAYVEANRSADDTVAAVGQAAAPYEMYYAPGLAFPATPGELAALEQPGRSVWILYSFPRDMRLWFSDLFDYMETHAELTAVFPGTLDDGNLYVARIDGMGR